MLLYHTVRDSYFKDMFPGQCIIILQYTKDNNDEKDRF